MQLILIDGLALYHACKARGFTPNHKALRETLSRGKQSKAIFYTGKSAGENQSDFLDWLRKNKIRVSFRGGVKDSRALVADICVDALTAKGFDEIILVSGAEDFVPLAEAFSKTATRFTVASFSNALSTRLAEAAEEVIHLDDLREDFTKR